MVHMYSMLVVKSRVQSAGLSTASRASNLTDCSALHFLPSKHDLDEIRGNLVILVSRILCKYIKPLKPLLSSVDKHITHQYSTEMALPSDVHVVDVLMKNENSSADMIEIIQHQQSFIPENFPKGHRIMSGGDHLTCERQIAAQHHLSDGDTQRERLELIEPQVEDWHALMNFMLVRICTCMSGFHLG